MRDISNARDDKYCKSKDYSFKYGNAHSRFDEDKRVRPNEYLGSQIAINHNRCILCSRCTRFTREVSGTSELFVEQRGYKSKIAIMEDNPLDNLLAGNVTDICPVGALLSTDYIHKNRIWNLNKKPSVCQDCSVGCNIDVFSKKDQFYSTFKARLFYLFLYLTILVGLNK